MTGFFLCFVTCLLFISNQSNARQIPDYIQKCKRNDPDVANCILKSVENLRPRLKNGIKELGVPPLDPFLIERLSVFRNDNTDRRSTHFALDLFDVVVFGAGDFVVDKFKIDIPNQIYRIDMKLPKLVVNGKYHVDAQILVVPIKGTGNFYLNCTNVDGNAVVKGEIKKSADGKNLMDFTEVTLKLNVNDYFIHLDNLFQGDAAMGKTINDLLNQNSKEYIKIAIPVVEANVAEIILKSAKSIVKNVDYDEAFPAE